MKTVEVRRATAEDEDAIVRVLARAFEADPVARFLLREDDYPGALALVFRAFTKHMTMSHGEVWIEAGGSGTALWTPPGAWDVTVRAAARMAPSLVRATGLSRLVRGGRALQSLQRFHPREPHYYLFAIGVDPAAQGRGIGSALLHAVLDTCDKTKTAAYLEASTEDSARLYARHGFRTTRELRVTTDAPPVWLMWREPQPEVALSAAMSA
jgi:ribosomal protein S18 acetylase RimI-like enzyme